MSDKFIPFIAVDPAHGADAFSFAIAVMRAKAGEVVHIPCVDVDSARRMMDSIRPLMPPTRDVTASGMAMLMREGQTRIERLMNQYIDTFNLSIFPRMLAIPVRVHKRRRWMSDAYHRRIQKKWLKRWGTLIEQNSTGCRCASTTT